MFAAVLPVVVFALSTLIQPSQDSFVDLWQHVDAIRDDTGRLTLEDVRAPSAPWQRSSALPEIHTATRLHPAVDWFRLRVRPAELGDYTIVVSQHALEADLFVPLPGGRVEHVRSGGDIPGSDKQISDENAIELPPAALDGRPIYLRVVTAYDHNTVFSLMGEASWLQSQVDREMWERPLLLWAGFVAAFGVLNILLAQRLRRATYAYYAAAVISAALEVVTLTGDGWRWIWPGIGVEYDIGINGSYTLAIGFAVWFGREFLQTRRNFPRLDALIVGLLGVFVAVNAMLIVFPEQLVAWGQYNPAESEATALAFAPLVCCAAIAVRRGSREALAYLLAVLGVLAGNVLGWAATNRLLPFDTILLIAPTLGFAWEALLLSIALAERLRSFERAASIDPLTRLANRRALDAVLTSEIEFASRTHAPLSALVLDIDKFKAYNDRFGHLAGDVALQLVAKTFADALRAIDCAARFGGEELVAVLPGTDLAGAHALAERMRSELRDAAVPHPDGVDGVLTVSIGAACARPGETGDALIARADAALYASKSTGRDRVSVAAP